MAQFCAACGAQMADGSAACAACGKAAGSGGAAPAAASGGNENIIALLCYSPVAIIGIILCLVVEPYSKNKFCRFHAFQAIFMAVALIAVYISVAILALVLGMMMPFILFLIPILYVLMWLGCIVLAIVMMIKAFQGQMTKLPLVGNLAAKVAGV
jgi:uncharacterized membrane protein